jgi:hypothetical protein
MRGPLIIVQEDRMHWKQIAARFTGVSSPIFGVSWNPPKPEIEIAQRLLNFLADRRVLFNAYEMEVPEHCIQSVLQIRSFLTDLLGELPAKDGLPDMIRSMRASCRRFLDQVQQLGGRERIRPFDGGMGFGFFGNALGKLRAAFGFQIGLVAVMYGLDIDPNLATILPPAPLGDDA